MKTRKHSLYILGLTIVLFLVLTVPVSAGDGVTRYWAVIVGIADYDIIPDLDFCADDADSVYNLLLQDSRWSASRITLLKNSQATRAAVETAISVMASNSDDDDICLFFYSGHGGQANVDFAPFDESDSSDEYIVCHDSDPANYSGDYIDDDLGDTLGLITGTKVVLLDACFSGGHIKSVTKELSAEKSQTPGNIKFIRKPFEKVIGTSKTPDGFVSDLIGNTSNLKDANDQSNIIVLTASDDDEQSAEHPDFRHGDFTYFLLLALKSNDLDNNGHVSAEEAFAYIDPALTGYTRSEYSPQLYDDDKYADIDLVKPTSERLVYIGHYDFFWDFPFNTYWKKRRAEYIYTQSQLGEAGFIKTLKIFVEEIPPLSLQNCTIRMQHTTQSSYSATPQWTSTGWTTVYSGTKTIDSLGLTSFELSTPFPYNGTDNLIIDFSYSNSTYSGDIGGFTGSYADSTYPMIMYAWDDDEYGEPTTWSGTSPVPVRDENNDPPYYYGSYLNLELEFVSFFVDTPTSSDNGVNDDGKSRVTITWTDSVNPDVNHYEVVAKEGSVPSVTDTVTGLTSIAPGTESAIFSWTSNVSLYVGVVAVDTSNKKTLVFNSTTPYVTVVSDTCNLTITKDGSGTGTVAGFPGNISCGATCQDSFSAGTLVTLTATSDVQSMFTGWSDCSTDQGSQISVTMNSDKTCTATFETDTDSDGMPDYWEDLYSLNSTVDDADEDKDGDGLTNLEEYLGGTNPAVREVKSITPILMLLLDSE